MEFELADPADGPARPLAPGRAMRLRPASGRWQSMADALVAAARIPAVTRACRLIQRPPECRRPG
jgi:hypothetical protein